MIGLLLMMMLSLLARNYCKRPLLSDSVSASDFTCSSDCSLFVCLSVCLFVCPFLSYSLSVCFLCSRAVWSYMTGWRWRHINSMISLLSMTTMIFLLLEVSGFSLWLTPLKGSSLIYTTHLHCVSRMCRPFYFWYIFVICHLVFADCTWVTVELLAWVVICLLSVCPSVTDVLWLNGAK